MMQIIMVFVLFLIKWEKTSKNDKNALASFWLDFGYFWQVLTKIGYFYRKYKSAYRFQIAQNVLKLWLLPNEKSNSTFLVGFEARFCVFYLPWSAYFKIISTFLTNFRVFSAQKLLSGSIES